MAKPKQPPAASKPENETQAANALRISSAREGFRRAGRAWSKTPAEIPLAELTDDQVAMLKAEPMLTVEDITLEAAAE